MRRRRSTSCEMRVMLRFHRRFVASQEARANHPDVDDDPSLAAIEAVWGVLDVLPNKDVPNGQ